MHILNWLGNLLSTYWLDVLLILAIVITFIVLIRKGIINKSTLVELAKIAVTQAERYYKSEAGQIKKQEAIKWLKDHSVFARLLSDAQIDILIEKAWEWLNEQLKAQAAKELEAKNKVVETGGD